MTPELAYFLKVNLAIALFYAFYRLFFYKDTFFKLRRTILLTFFGMAFLYPLFNIQDWITAQEPIAEVVTLYVTMLPEVTTVADLPLETDWTGILIDLIFYSYIGGVIVLSVRFFMQLSSILLLSSRSKKTVINGIQVHILDKESGPFSFFRLIFIHPQSHSFKEAEEILAHENTHVRQLHSIDVIVSELIAIICWMNPFVWLLKREVRHNLEYLADNTVIQSGFDTRSYQYHLLGLAHHQGVTNLYNSFNMLHLKNRITMMNKKRSRSIGQTKYLMFIPLAAILMLFSNIEAVARVTRSFANHITDNMNGTVVVKAKVVDENKEPIAGAKATIKGTTTGTITDLDGVFSLNVPEDATIEVSFIDMENKAVLVKDFTKDMVIQLSLLKGKTGGTEDASSQIFTVVEQMPEFPGGEEALLQFISRNIKYPVIAQENGIQGRVMCSFIVEADGKTSNLEILKGVDASLDKEALRVLSSMPVWTPGKQRGKAVRVKFITPIVFRLQGENEKKLVSEPDEKNQVTVVAFGKAEKASDDAQKKNESQIYSVVETMPMFPGGESELLAFVNKSVKYPVIAQENGIQGRVICSFIVKKDGTITDVVVKRGVDPSLDAEAIRVLESMPAWTPGKQKGIPVNVQFMVPITFRLGNDNAIPSDIKFLKDKGGVFVVDDVEMSFTELTSKHTVATIQSIEVIRSEEMVKKYGEKAKDGVVLISTKKKQ